MSFKAVLTFKGNEYNVLSYSYTCRRDLDASGRPSSPVRGHIIDLTIEATEDTSFVKWMWMQYEVESGTITFYKRDSEQKMIEMKFKEAYIGMYNRTFNAEGSDPFIERFQISAKEYDFGDANVVAFWIDE